MAIKGNSSPLWHPRNWWVWCIVALLWATTRILPFRAQLAVGRWLGRIGYRLAASRRHVAEVNLGLCFPEKSQQERDRIVLQHFESLGMGLFELSLSWWGDLQRMKPLGHIEGVEHLEAAKADGRGVLLLACHVTAHELGACLFAQSSPLQPYGIYKPFKNPVVDWISRRRRSRYATLIPRSSMRSAIRHLKAGGLVWYAPDQSEGAKAGVLVTFFGEPKTQNTGTARIAQMSGALVVPFQVSRRPAGGYRLTIAAPLEGFPSGDKLADAQRITQVVEEQVLIAPEQYSWVHKRFRKRRGTTLASPYSD